MGISMRKRRKSDNDNSNDLDRCYALARQFSKNRNGRRDDDDDEEEYEDNEDNGGNMAMDLARGLGSLAKIADLFDITDTVQGKTSDGRNSGSLKFQRRAGSVKRIKIRNNKVDEIEIEPDDWPPRSERF